MDASPFDAWTLRNITNIMASKEDLIYKALKVSVARDNQYCQKVEERFLEELSQKKPKTLDGMGWSGSGITTRAAGVAIMTAAGTTA